MNPIINTFSQIMNITITHISLNLKIKLYFLPNFMAITLTFGILWYLVFNGISVYVIHSQQHLK